MVSAAIQSPTAAFVAGLVTSIHCAGMCGPLACSLLSSRVGGAVRVHDAQTIATAYHVFRLTGYALVGGIGGAIGHMPLIWMSGPTLRWAPWSLVVFFVAIALRLDRLIPKPVFVARLNGALQRWSRGRSGWVGAAAMGLGTPLLPCGPLYFVLSLAILSGSMLRGVEFMVAFGLGTVPLLWLAQTQFQWVRRKLNPLWLDRTRLAVALVTAGVIAWRLRATLGLPGPEVGSFVCH